ncbi:cytochrome c-type biogenesis protein [Modicisalibacter radicis]|uniref:cytochrome c-type biogenesis protein n=1 Tax=Halomonas sp. EAR18 TaxID=2518972 RepID=UPI00109D0E6E|nr:cytochrome c-type biogenesis protein [Halomonas sp. EAR18]
MSRPLVGALALCLTLLATASPAAVEVRAFDDPALGERYVALAEELRCPQCPNQTIADSDAPIAGDMRERVAALLRDGRSDAEIRDFLVARFGEYVRYDPRPAPRTWPLWGVPAALVAIGALVLAMLVRRRARRVVPLSATERERLAELVSRDEPGATRDRLEVRR